jgi:hypothetical protein
MHQRGAVGVDEPGRHQGPAEAAGLPGVRKIKVTEGNCYEVYAIDAQGDKVEVYLDPTNGSLVAKED